MPTAPKPPPPAPEPEPKPEAAADAPAPDAPAQGYAPSMDPTDPRSREEREAEAFSKLSPEAQASLPDQMKPPPPPEAKP